MKKVRVSEATGIVLDYLVAKCEGYWATIKSGGIVYTHPDGNWHSEENWSPSSKWVQGGPIIEREVYKVFRNVGNSWTAMIKKKEPYFSPTYQLDILVDKFISKSGPTALVASLRCYVYSKLGEEVEVPDELLGGRLNG